MLNIEYYADELQNYWYEDFAINKDKQVVLCESLNCKDCIFSGKGCNNAGKFRWLLEEYKETFLNDEAIAYLISAVNPDSLDNVITITKNQDSWTKRYNIEIKMTDGLVYRYFDEDSHLDDLFSKLKIEHPYSMKELGLC